MSIVSSVVDCVWPKSLKKYIYIYIYIKGDNSTKKNQDGHQGKDPFSMVNISMIVFFCCIIFCFQEEQTYVYKKNYRTV